MENIRDIMNLLRQNTQSNVTFTQIQKKYIDMEQKLVLRQIENPSELQNKLFQIINYLINGNDVSEISTSIQEESKIDNLMEVQGDTKSEIKKPKTNKQKIKQQQDFTQDPKKLFISSVLNLLFETESEKQAQESIEQLQKLGGTKGICGKVMTRKDTGFKCLDCQLDNTCIICKECFEKGNHKGHRVYIQQGCSGVCDCGDVEAWKKEGNCCDHSGFINQDKLSLDQIPKRIILNFQEIFTELLYQYFTMCENIFVINQDLQFNYIKGHKKLSEYFSYIIELLKLIIGDNLLITYLTHDFLQKKMEGRKFSHQCVDLRTNVQSKQEHICCSCTIFENIFRFNCFLVPSYQKELSSFFISLNSLYSFKQNLVITYTKMYNFLIQQVDCDIFPSKICELAVQLYTSDELAIIAINSDYFYFILEKLQVYLSLIVDDIQKLGEMQNFYELYHHIDYVCMKPMSLLKFVQKEGMFEKMIHIAKCVQFAVKYKMQKKKQEQDDFSKNELMINVEIDILKIIYRMISCVYGQLDQKQAEQIYVSWIQVVIYEIQNTTNLESKTPIFSSFHIPLHRILSLLIFAISDFNLENLSNMQNKLDILNKQNFDFCEFFVQQSQIPLQVFSFCKEIEKKIWINASYEIQNYISIYFKSKFLFFNIDSVFMQIAILINQYSKTQTDIFSIFRNNFTRNQLWKYVCGIKDVQKMKKINIEDFQKVIPLASDFMNLISYLSVDQISIYNVCMKIFEESPCQQIKFISLCVSPITVYMQMNKLIDLKSLKEKLCANLLNNKTNFEEILKKICDFDKQKKLFKLKSNLEGQYVESYIFYSDGVLFSDYNEKLNEKYKKEEQYISVLGTISPDTQSSLSQQIIASILSDESYFFFKQLLNLNNSPINKNIYLINNFLIQQLKIISLYNESSFSKPNLIIQFNSLLNEINKFDQIHEQTLSAIKFLQKKMSTQETIDQITDNNIQVEEESKSNKKEKALSKQQLILQQFQKKAQQFSDKNKQIIDTEESKNQNTNTLTCVICKDAIKEKENYAMAGYMTKSNILKFANFSMHKNQILFEKDEIRLSQLEQYSDIDNPVWELDKGYFQFSSCSHALHIGCTHNYQKRQAYKSEYEFSCPLCNRLSNIFINQLSGIQVYQKINEEILENSQQLKKSNKRQIKKLISGQDFIIQDDLSISKKICEESQSLEIHDSLEQQLQQINISENQVRDEIVNKVQENADKDIKEFPKMIQQLKNNLMNFDPEKIVNNYKINLSEVDKNITQSVITFVDRLTIIKLHESEDLQNDNEILDLMENSIIESIKNIDLLGFYNFYSKEEPIQKELVLIYLIFFQNFESTKKNEFLLERKNFLMSFIDLFANNQDQLVKKSFVELDLETLLIKINVYIGFYTQINNFDKIQNEILILLLIGRVIQVSIKKNEQPQVLQRFSDVQYIKYLLPLVRKMLAFRIITKDYDEILIKKFLNNSLLNDDVWEFNQILYLLGIQVLQIEKIFTKNLLFFQNQKTKNCNFNIMRLQEDYTLSFIPLEDKFGDLYGKYILMKCFKCNDFPKHHDMCICLLCGTTLCSISCQANYSYSGQGNLNKHSKEKHIGTSVFLSVYTASIYIIKSPLNACIGPLYFDQFGESFDKKRKNWNDFYLDSEVFNKIRKMIINNTVAQEIIYASLREGVKYKEGIF